MLSGYESISLWTAPLYSSASSVQTMSLFLTRPPRTGLAFVAHMLCRHRRPRAWLSSLSFVPADSQTDREVPTPLLFLSAPRWTGDQPASQYVLALSLSHSPLCMYAFLLLTPLDFMHRGLST